MFRKIIKGLKDVWCGTLEFDTEPKKDSFNPVTSGGVYDAINGAGGAKEIVYFDVDPSDPPSGIYEAIGEALSNNKLPVIKIDGAMYFYTATGTDKYVFVGGFTKESVGYTEIEVSDDDSVTSKSVDDKVFNMYMLYRTDPASPGDPPGTGDQPGAGYWICDENKHVITKTELMAAHANCRYFVLNNDIEPDSNTRKYFASVTVISNSNIRILFSMIQTDDGSAAEFTEKLVMADSEGRLYVLRSYEIYLAGTNNAVLVSEPQNFDSTQKAQGRANIGACGNAPADAFYVNRGGEWVKAYSLQQIAVEGFPVDDAENYEKIGDFNGNLYPYFKIEVTGEVEVGMFNYDTKQYDAEFELSDETHYAQLDAGGNYEIHAKGTGTLSVTVSADEFEGGN